MCACSGIYTVHVGVHVQGQWMLCVRACAHLHACVDKSCISQCERFIAGRSMYVYMLDMRLWEYCAEVIGVYA